MSKEKPIVHDQALGYVRIDYQGPPKTSRQVRDLRDAVMRVLDRLGVPAGTAKNEALQQKTIDNGLIELQLKIPVSLLEEAQDPISLQIQAAEQRHYGASVRAALRDLFDQWRRQSVRR